MQRKHILLILFILLATSLVAFYIYNYNVDSLVNVNNVALNNDLSVREVKDITSNTTNSTIEQNNNNANSPSSWVVAVSIGAFLVVSLVLVGVANYHGLGPIDPIPDNVEMTVLEQIGR